MSVPAGAHSGYAIRVKGDGETVNGRPGDLYLIVNVEQHPLFDRRDDDLYVEKEIAFTLAALGGTVEMTGLDGNPFNVDIAEGTQTGDVIRIDGKGMPHVNSEGRGDMCVVVRVMTPANLGQRQRELLRKFQELETSQ